MFQKIHFFYFEVEKTTSNCLKWTIDDHRQNLQFKFKFRYFSRAEVQALEKNFFFEI